MDAVAASEGKGSMMDTQPEWKWSGSFCMATNCCAAAAAASTDFGGGVTQGGHADDVGGLGIDFGVGTECDGGKCLCPSCACDSGSTTAQPKGAGGGRCDVAYACALARAL